MRNKEKKRKLHYRNIRQVSNGDGWQSHRCLPGRYRGVGGLRIRKVENKLVGKS